MSSFVLNLAELSEGMPGLTSHQGGAFAEAAAVCLENQGHGSGVVGEVTGTHAGTAEINWPTVDAQQRASHADLQDATEDGATAVAVLAVKAMTGLVVRERAVKGTGIDYWLGHDSVGDDDLPFQDLTRLEVSGILSGSSDVISARVAQKLLQTEPTDHVCPVYVAVVEFGEPVVHVEAK